MRGREAYVQIRTQLHILRSNHVEPLCVWVNQATAHDMHKLLAEVCGADRYDGKLPSVAGCKVKVGSTGGSDYLFEYFDSNAEAYQARDAMDKVFKVQDNPLDGTH